MNNLTVCDKFLPIILEGQLCYTLDLSKASLNYPTKSGKNNGLFLLVDPFPYRQNHTDKNGEGFKGGGDQDIKVFIHTLAQYSTLGPGSYAMSTLKKITGTTSFKELPEPLRKCTVHKREECQTQKYMEQTQKQCKCIPWALQTNQVMKYKHILFLIGRSWPSVAQRKRFVLQTKPQRTEVVWFLVKVSILILWMTF